MQALKLVHVGAREVAAIASSRCYKIKLFVLTDHSPDLGIKKTLNANALRPLLHHLTTSL